MKSNQGLIRLLILILIALIILGYYGFSVRQAVTNPTTEDNISYVWGWAVYVWDNYLQVPATYLWDIFVNYIWTPALNNLAHVSAGSSTPMTAPALPGIPQ